jgi:hypothetical protein
MPLRRPRPASLPLCQAGERHVSDTEPRQKREESPDLASRPPQQGGGRGPTPAEWIEGLARRQGPDVPGAGASVSGPHRHLESAGRVAVTRPRPSFLLGRAPGGSIHFPERSIRCLRLHKLRQAGEGSFTTWTPLRNVGDRLLPDLRTAQPVNRFGVPARFASPPCSEGRGAALPVRGSVGLPA